MYNHHSRSRNAVVAQQIYHLQQAAYTVERDLIDYPDFPPLQVTSAEIQAEEEHFLGYLQDGGAGRCAFVSNNAALLDIGRLIVHPQAFRRGRLPAPCCAKSNAAVSRGTSSRFPRRLRIYQPCSCIKNMAINSPHGRPYPMG
ncbi:MAG: hypothetical protein R3E79_16340 [Caldilineaceae bacterium]